MALGTGHGSGENTRGAYLGQWWAVWYKQIGSGEGEGEEMSSVGSLTDGVP